MGDERRFSEHGQLWTKDDVETVTLYIVI